MRDDWALATFNDVVNIISGKNQRRVENPNGKYPIYGSSGVFGYANEYLCPAGATIIGRKGTINKPLFINEKFWNVDTAFGMIPNNFINPKILYYFCRSFNFTKLDKSTTIPSLAKRDLLKIEMPIIPLPEQRAIVKKVEELFSELDNGIENLKIAQEKLKLYRQSVLKKAFEGGLTEEWRKAQKDLPSAEALLEQIKEVRQKHYDEKVVKWKAAVKEWAKSGKEGKKPKKPRMLDISVNDNGNILQNLPSLWGECKVADVISDLTDYHANGSYSVLKENVELFDEPNYAVMIRATNFEKNDFECDLKYINDHAYNFLSKSKLFGGEILIGKIGNAGKVYYMPNISSPASLAMNLFAIRTCLILSQYFYYQLLSYEQVKQIKVQ